MNINKNSTRATKDMCLYCFDVLNNRLSSNPLSVSHGITDAQIKSPLFITWEQNHKYHGWILRGCIGNFSRELDLVPALKDYALISALKDHRFQPIKKSELPHLRCAVSILHSFEESEDPFDWDIGTHGIYIHFNLPNGKQTSSTFLPEVCPEQKWSKMECLTNLLKKGGHKGHSTATKDWITSSVKLTRYQSSKVKITYDEYIKHINSSKSRVSEDDESFEETFNTSVKD